MKKINVSKTYFFQNKFFAKLFMVMKITVLLLLFAMGSVFAKSTYSQNTRLSLHLENATLQQVFDEIQKKSEFIIFYKDNQVDVNHRSNVDLDDVTVEQILNQALISTDLGYKIIDRQIVILADKSKVSPSTILSESNSGQQKKEISGTVKDPKGFPLPGVSVVVKGTTIGTVSDSEGKFKINVPSDSKTLVFSFIGLKTQEIALGNNSSFKVTLAEEAVGLDEVVAVGYGTEKKVNVTGSVSSVTNEDLIVAPVASTTAALPGLLPGLITKQSTGAPGNDALQLNIRGFDSPLVIVDGVEQDFNGIDPNEIESISVLKDAAAAIYGARAGNGVVLVTTKRGHSGKPTITLNSSFTEQGVTLFPKPVNAGQYAEIITEAELNSGIASQNTRFSADDIKKYYAGTDPNYPNTNWWKVIMNNWAPQQQHNLSMSGGNDKVKYYGFLGYTNQVGMFKTGDDKFSRYNVRSNVDANVTDNLSLSLDLSVINAVTNEPSRDLTDIWMDFYDAQPIYPSSLPDPNKLPFVGTNVLTPLAETSRKLGGYNDITNQTLNGALTLTYKIPKITGLSLKGMANYNQINYGSKDFWKQTTVYTYDNNTKAYTNMGSDMPTTLDQYSSHTNLFTTQLSLNYNRKFAEFHNLKAMVLFETVSENDNNFSAHGEDFLTSSIDYLFAAGSVNQRVGGSANQMGRASVVGRINYSFKDKYLLEGTIRDDASAKFPPNHRWGLFPSISAGWKASEESFVKNSLPWIYNLKLRASYGQMGYDGIGNFQYLSGYQFTTPYVFNEVAQPGLGVSGLANPDLTWEKMKIYNGGLDMSILKGKIYTIIDAFYREQTGIPANRMTSLPTTFGANLPLENLNSQNNRGFEITLGNKGRKGEFIWDVNANFSYSRAKWQHFEEPTYTDPDQKRIYQQSGQWTDRYFGYKSAGLFTSQAEINNLGFDQDGQGNATLHPGDIKYIDKNKDGKLDWKDQVVIGDGTMPHYMYGLNIKLKYKNFDFSCLGQGALMFSTWVQYQIDSYRTPQEQLFKNRWTTTNNNAHALYPRQTMNPGTNNNQSSDFWLKSGNYFRLKTFSLGYSIPSRLTNKVNISRLRFYLAGTNVFTFSALNKFDMDPESPTGSHGWYYPQQRTFALGVNLTL